MPVCSKRIVRLHFVCINYFHRLPADYHFLLYFLQLFRFLTKSITQLLNLIIQIQPRQPLYQLGYYQSGQDEEK